ncbi:hypothetical protein OPV22_028535 [Ensete ventricosum]|uniref:DUF4408 domain-containing protein n=1 Tax=Ensete ventricosum TaxID=4639 RepID=A0AAV8PYI5_ENSVE|nr:hypothetical protein OPV22_028535 [Ensete ventricosum]
MANPRWNSQTNGYDTAIWAAKITFCFIGILSFGAAARAAVPAAVEALASAVPGFWEFLRTWLAPPYLFIAVHFIILVIWKLSDQKQEHHQHREQWAAAELMAEPGNPAKVKSFEPLHISPVPILRKPSPEMWRDEISPSPTTPALRAPDPGESSTSDASCLTTESGEISTASSASVVKKSAEPESMSSLKVKKDEDEAAAVATAAGIENDSMEATWKAIMEKSSRAAGGTATGGVVGAGLEATGGHSLIYGRQR